MRRNYGSAINIGSSTYGLRFNYSPLENHEPMAAGTAYIKVYHTDANTWTIFPDQVPPPSGVNDPNATSGKWSVLLNRNDNPATVAGYQKTPFKIAVKKL